MILTADVFQFLSRSNIPDGKLCTWKSTSAPLPHFTISVDYDLCPKPFELAFADIRPCTHRSIGAYQYVDEEVDYYMKRRWPKCIKGIASIETKDIDIKEPDNVTNLLDYLLLNLDKLFMDGSKFPDFRDQYATTKGIQRTYYNHQIFDIVGSRRPLPIGMYKYTEEGCLIGPGVVTIRNFEYVSDKNELVWSQIIPFPQRTTKAEDIIRVNDKVAEIIKHYNSYNELKDSIRLIQNNEIKASVRAAASAVDATLRYYCAMWGVTFPKDSKPFNEKIESILSQANKPSFALHDRASSNLLLYLYRARSSMHEGGCFYKDMNDTTISIIDKKQALPLINAAELFSIWIDSIV